MGKVFFLIILQPFTQLGLNPEQLFYFNREDVDKVVYPGYSDEEEERFAEIYQRWLDENSETIKKRCNEI